MKKKYWNISNKLNRTPRQCRDRWKYKLNPTINKKPWTNVLWF